MAGQPTVSSGLPYVPDAQDGQQASLSPRPTEGRRRAHQLHLGVTWTSAIPHSSPPHSSPPFHSLPLARRVDDQSCPSDFFLGVARGLWPIRTGRKRSSINGQKEAKEGLERFDTQIIAWSAVGCRSVKLAREPHGKALAYAERYMSPQCQLTALEESEKAWSIVTMYNTPWE